MSRNQNQVFYAKTYHPIQAGSIDGTDILPHDNAVYRALLCSNAALYDSFGDPKVIGDPYCTLFVARLSHLTTEDTLAKTMNKYGRVKNLRLVRHIVTGASCGYAFVEFEKEKDMRLAYKDAHRSFIDDFEIIVDYNRQHLMPGWIPRRLGGGLSGKKESGQLRFGGRDRPFRAPLYFKLLLRNVKLNTRIKMTELENNLFLESGREIPFDDLKRLGIPPPPEGRYMSRHQIPSPPRRKRSNSYEIEDFDRHGKGSVSSRQHERSSSPDRSYRHHKQNGHSHKHKKKRPNDADSSSRKMSYLDKEDRGYMHHKDSHLHDR